MGRIKHKNSKPEIAVRRMIHAMGFRFRLHQRKLPGSPDIVFPRLRSVVFVHGCFWHRHECHLGRLPKSRLDFWLAKLDANRRRDIQAQHALTGLGWRQLIVWECELRDMAALQQRVATFLGGN